jgi:hypothetical protein
MAGDSESSRAADKGKKDAVDGDPKAEDVKKDKDSKAAVNGKKEDEKAERS